MLPMQHSAPAGARLFLALWPDERVRRDLSAVRDAWPWPPRTGRVPSASLHLTLHFLGDVPRRGLPELVAGLDVPAAPFDLRLDRAALWPGGIAVIEPGTVPAPLLVLHTTLGDALTALGVPLERRPYRPHVTLARRARGAVPPGAAADVAWAVRGYALIESGAGARGGYGVVHAWG